MSRHGSTASSHSARSRTTPTSPTSASPARQPDPVLPNHRTAADHRGDHRLGPSPTGPDPAHAPAHGRTRRARYRSNGRLTAAPQSAHVSGVPFRSCHPARGFRPPRSGWGPPGLACTARGRCHRPGSGGTGRHRSSQTRGSTMRTRTRADDTCAIPPARGTTDSQGVIQFASGAPGLSAEGARGIPRGLTSPAGRLPCSSDRHSEPATLGDHEREALPAPMLADLPHLHTTPHEPDARGIQIVDRERDRGCCEVEPVRAVPRTVPRAGSSCRVRRGRARRSRDRGGQRARSSSAVVPVSEMVTWVFHGSAISIVRPVS